MSQAQDYIIRHEIYRLEDKAGNLKRGVGAGVVKIVFWFFFGLYFVESARRAGDAKLGFITFMYFAGLATLALLTLVIGSMWRRAEAELRLFREATQGAAAQSVWPPVPREQQ